MPKPDVHEHEKAPLPDPPKAPEARDARDSLRQHVLEGLADIEAALANEWGNEQGNAAKQPARAALARLRAKIGG